MISPFQLLDI